MQTQTKSQVNYYTAFGEDDEMSQTDVHNNLIIYSMAVLNEMFAGQNVGIFTSIQLYGDPLYPNRAKRPDLLVIDGLVSTPEHEVSSYYITSTNPPPRFLMEVSSKENWDEDLEFDHKQGVYERMGITEYFVCDPHTKPVWKREWRKHGRLVGWKFNPFSRRFEPIEPDAQGRLKSVSLDSKLVMEGYAERELHLYDAKGVLRLTPAQAQWKRAEAERERAEAERERAEAAQKLAEVARRQAEAAQNQAKIEQERAEAARELAEAERARAEAENQLRITAEQRIKELEARLRQLEDK